ncbi:MAG TPA: hypothetical protein VGG62_09235 [Terracidiphilus sp.]|jgi:hypothetical protein
MEADWEVEIGGEAPVIQADWDGFIDLRLAPDCAGQLPEAAHLPALADTLVRLNSASSPVCTSKCDVWHPDTFDPDELDAPPGERNFAIACYIDLLPRGDKPWPGPEHAVGACESLCARLRPSALRGCRADLIVRRAFLPPGRFDLGVTAYFTACGATSAEAAAVLASALAAFVNSLSSLATPAPALQSYNE